MILTYFYTQLSFTAIRMIRILAWENNSRFFLFLANVALVIFLISSLQLVAHVNNVINNFWTILIALHSITHSTMILLKSYEVPLSIFTFFCSVILFGGKFD